jgi:5-methylcytosine-specific restriction endonuclease McrA
MSEATTLVIDKTGYPVDIVTWRDALGLIRRPDCAHVLDEDSDRVLNTVDMGIPMPLVVQLRNYIAVKARTRVPFSRKNILLRDDLRCQFCAMILSTKECTLDHILPRSRGGKSTWENLVVACRGCNKRKDNKTPKEAGMRLLKAPVEPSPHDPRYNFRLSLKNVKPEWSPYFYWNAPLEP